MKPLQLAVVGTWVMLVCVIIIQSHNSSSLKSSSLAGVDTQSFAIAISTEAAFGVFDLAITGETPTGWHGEVPIRW